MKLSLADVFTMAILGKSGQRAKGAAGNRLNRAIESRQKHLAFKAGGLREIGRRKAQIEKRC